MPKKHKEQPYSHKEKNGTFTSIYKEKGKQAFNLPSQQKEPFKTVASKDNIMKNSKANRNNKGTSVLSSIQPTVNNNESLKNDLASPYSSLFAEPKEFQEAIFSFSFQSAESLSDAADVAIKNFQESVEAVVTSGNTLAEAVETTNQEITRFTNQLFSDSLEASKDLLKCQTINDAFALQSNILRNTMESCLGSFIKTNEIILHYTTKALQPLNEQTTATLKSYKN